MGPSRRLERVSRRLEKVSRRLEKEGERREGGEELVGVLLVVLGGLEWNW